MEEVSSGRKREYFVWTINIADIDIRDTKRVYLFLSILYPFIKHGEVKCQWGRWHWCWWGSRTCWGGSWCSGVLISDPNNSKVLLLIKNKSRNDSVDAKSTKIKSCFENKQVCYKHASSVLSPSVKCDNQRYDERFNIRPALDYR